MRDLGKDALGDRPGTCLGVRARQHHDEFVPGLPRYEVGLAYAAFKAPRDLDQHRIARQVPETVVDLFQPVHVDEEERQRLAVTLRPGAGPGKPDRQRAPVGQPGQNVELCLAPGLFVGLL